MIDSVTTEGTIFTYGENKYDLSERNGIINSIMGFTPVGHYIIIESHTGPEHAVYSIFNTETQDFEKDIVSFTEDHTAVEVGILDGEELRIETFVLP